MAAISIRGDRKRGMGRVVWQKGKGNNKWFHNPFCTHTWNSFRTAPHLNMLPDSHWLWKSCNPNVVFQCQTDKKKQEKHKKTPEREKQLLYYFSHTSVSYSMCWFTRWLRHERFLWGIGSERTQSSWKYCSDAVCVLLAQVSLPMDTHMSLTRLLRSSGSSRWEGCYCFTHIGAQIYRLHVHVWPFHHVDVVCSLHWQEVVRLLRCFLMCKILFAVVQHAEDPLCSCPVNTHSRMCTSACPHSKTHK